MTKRHLDYSSILLILYKASIILLFFFLFFLTFCSNFKGFSSPTKEKHSLTMMLPLQCSRRCEVVSPVWRAAKCKSDFHFRFFCLSCFSSHRVGRAWQVCNCFLKVVWTNGDLKPVRFCFIYIYNLTVP